MNGTDGADVRRDEERVGEMTERDYAALFGVDEAHTLALSRHHRTRRAGTLHETRWLEERDRDARLVARYRLWFNRSSHAPYRTQLGWERWSLEGRLLDREVRYATRADRESLH